MMVNIEKSKKAATAIDFQVLANSFARIAEAEQKEWTAWYYAAFYNLAINFQDSVNERKEKFDKFIPVDFMAPDWGKDRCEMLISGAEGQVAND